MSFGIPRSRVWILYLGGSDDENESVDKSDGNDVWGGLDANVLFLLML